MTLSTPRLTVPPTGYGGTEAVIDLLATGFAAAGHDVLLATTGDSTCPVATTCPLPAAVGTAHASAATELHHVIRSYEAIGNANKIALLTTLLGIAAAVAGAGDAAMAGMALGQQAALSSFLSFSRGQEASADAASVTYLKCAGISGRGAVSFFRKLQNLEFRYGYSQSDEAGYARTHPLTGDRISRLEAELQSDPAWGGSDADLTAQIDASPPPTTIVAPPSALTSEPQRLPRRIESGALHTAAPTRLTTRPTTTAIPAATRPPIHHVATMAITTDSGAIGQLRRASPTGPPRA